MNGNGIRLELTVVHEKGSEGRQRQSMGEGAIFTAKI